MCLLSCFSLQRPGLQLTLELVADLIRAGTDMLSLVYNSFCKIHIIQVQLL